jgi:S1-C subfamily serine protease
MKANILRALILFSCTFFLSPLKSYGAEGDSKLTNKNPLDASFASPIDMTTVGRVTSTLQRLSKNLILEGTRGEKDVAVFQKAASAVVFVLAGKDSIGSGVLISRDGRVLTNWHVVGSNSQVIVFLKPKNSSELRRELAFAATVEKTDQTSDLALLQMINPPPSLSFVALGNGSSLNVGQDAHAIGHPKGEVWTYTRGIISQIRGNYQWKTEEGFTHRANVIQTQTPINPGNSGGPLLDDQANLIGINSFGTPGSEGLNFAISVDTIREFLKEFPAKRDSRQVAQPSSSDLKCVEGYDTMRRGWNDIIGCYKDSVSPPPDIWGVFRDPTKNPVYVAMDSDTSGKSTKIDLVKKPLDSQWKYTDVYVDSNCDGVVDVIVTLMKGNNALTTSRLPPTNLRMTTLAKELDTNLKRGIIPYPNLHVCQ